MSDKKCRKCREVKPLDEFYKHSDCLDGHVCTCKECYRSASKIDRNVRREHFRAKNKENYEKHKSARQEYSKKYMHDHKQEKSEYCKIWREQNHVELLAKKKAYYYSHLEQRTENRHKHLEREAIRVKVYNHNKKSNGGKFTAEEWQMLCEYYGNKCLCCGLEETTVDHIVPVKFGGGSSIDNLQPLCKSCNSSKQTKTIDYRPDHGEFAKGLM